MNPLGLLRTIYLIGRYLREREHPSCERAGRQMAEYVNDLLSGGCGLVEGYFLGACLLLLAIGVVAAVRRAIGWVLGLRWTVA